MRNSYPTLLLLALCTLLTACTTSPKTTPVSSTGAQVEAPAAAAPRILTDFGTDDLSWSIEDDRVMGGVSRGKVEMTEDGHLRFWGNVSTENNGGFSSVQSGYDETFNLDGLSSFNLRLKGDGKNYTFRVKRDRNERHSYAYAFPTSGEWETITVPFAELKPTFRGYTPNLPAFAGEPINQLRILIGNKKEQSFDLLMDKISAE